MSERITVVGNTLSIAGKAYCCAIGKSGFSDHKKEGDGCTPIGTFALRECWYRADRMAAPQTGLPLRVIQENDGWCDDPASGEYNKHIKLPLPPGEGWGEGDATYSMRSSSALPSFGASRHLLPKGKGFSFENLWRSDHVYDLIIPLGYNDDPVIPGLGSAIFLHVAKPDYAPTEGCVALAMPDLLEALKLCDSGTVMEIHKG